MIISERLKALAEMVTPCGVAADIGCDHCFTLIYMIKNGICQKGIGCDVKKGPLLKAAENLEKHGLSEKIELRLGSGFKPLKEGECDTAIISGMGGYLIIDILNDSGFLPEELVIQPQLDAAPLRKELHRIGYRIVKETMIEENSKFYIALRTVKGKEKYGSDMEYEYGRLLLEEKNQVLEQYLLAKKRKNEAIMLKSQKRLVHIEEETKKIEEALLCLQGL